MYQCCTKGLKQGGKRVKMFAASPNRGGERFKRKPPREQGGKRGERFAAAPNRGGVYNTGQTLVNRQKVRPPDPNLHRISTKK